MLDAPELLAPADNAVLCQKEPTLSLATSVHQIRLVTAVSLFTNSEATSFSALSLSVSLRFAMDGSIRRNHLPRQSEKLYLQ